LDKKDIPKGLESAQSFSLFDAIFGRRSRRFLLGGSIPDGYFKYESKHKPMPLSELEKMLVLTAAGGNTGWHHLIMHHKKYAPYLSNYALSAGGRTFPSGAGFSISELFFTDDNGVYFFETRDAPNLIKKTSDGQFDIVEILEAHESRIRKLSDNRLYLSPEGPQIEGHNTWVVNRPGSMLMIPVGDLAEHVLGNIIYYIRNGVCIYDDINNKHIQELERFKNLVNIEDPLPLTYLEQLSMSELTIELGVACHSGMLMLQAIGLGGWLFNGINPYSILGVSGEPDIPGLGFRYDTDERWPLPNPTGLKGVLEGHCPPHYSDMRSAVEAIVERKFGHGGPFHPDTPGPYKDTRKVRSSAQPHSEEFKECATVTAQYIYDTFGKFPGTVPSIFLMPYLQAHHLDLDFYDNFFKPGSYLETHANHMELWHREDR
jgi:hypothetical protein